jgi:hypothetical protein
MSQQSRTFFEKLKEGAKTVLRDVIDETARVVRQGSSELSSTIFQGHAYVPYGTGQVPTKDGKRRDNPGEEAKKEAEARNEPEHDRGQERGGRE